MELSALPPQSAPNQTPRQTASNAGTLSSDFETFIRMLTAQARYQDPLEPLDSSQYASQLAQFSMVEQQVLANDRLEALTAALTTGNVAALAGWVGMEARAPAPVRWEGVPVDVTARPAPGSETVTLVIRSARGTEIARQTQAATQGPLVWDGRDDAGSVLPFGTYDIDVESHAQGVLLASDRAETYGRVVEAQVIGGETFLLLASGAQVAATAVTALRQPR